MSAVDTGNANVFGEPAVAGRVRGQAPLVRACLRLTLHTVGGLGADAWNGRLGPAPLTPASVSLCLYIVHFMDFKTALSDGVAFESNEDFEDILIPWVHWSPVFSVGDE